MKCENCGNDDALERGKNKVKLCGECHRMIMDSYIKDVAAYNRVRVKQFAERAEKKLKKKAEEKAREEKLEG